MTQPGRQAPYQDGIPVVQNSTDRALRFPSPVTDQRVHNLQSGAVERFTAGGWSADLIAPRVFDVKVYGAIGDGVADDTAAIQAAFAAALAAHGTLYFPPGTYRYSASLGTITSRMTVMGAGWRASILKPLTTYTGYAFTVQDVIRDPNEDSPSITTTTAAGVGVVLRDFAVIGDYGTAARGVRTNGGVDLLTLDSLYFGYLNGTAVAMGVDETTHAYVRESWMRNVRIANCGNASEPFLHITTGSQTTSSDGTNQVTVSDCFFVYNYSAAVIEGNAANVNCYEVRRIRLNNIMLHGRDTYVGSRPNDDLLILRGKLRDIQATNLNMNASNTGYYCVRMLADGSGNYPQGVNLHVGIKNCDGGAVRVERAEGWTVTGNVHPASITGAELSIAAGATLVQGEYTPVAPTSTRSDTVDTSCQAFIYSPSNPTRQKLRVYYQFSFARVSKTQSGGGTLVCDASQGNYFDVSVTDTTAFAISVTNATGGQMIFLDLVNNSGGVMGAVTFNAMFKQDSSYASPASGKRRTATFSYNGTNLVLRGTWSGDM